MSTPSDDERHPEQQTLQRRVQAEPPKALSFKIITACAGSVTRNASSIPYPATHTIRSVSSTTSGTASRARRATFRSTKKSCSFFWPANPTAEMVARTAISDRQRAAAKIGAARRSIRPLRRDCTPCFGPRLAPSRQKRRSPPRATHLSWNRQRIPEKVRDRAARRPAPDLSGDLPVKTTSRPMRSTRWPGASKSERAPSAQPTGDRHVSKSSGRPPASSLMQRQSSARCSASGAAASAGSVASAAGRPLAATQRASSVDRRGFQPRPCSRARRRPRRPATSTIAGLNRASSSGSSSARTRLRGMLTSALVSSSTNAQSPALETRAQLDRGGNRAADGRSRRCRGCIAARPRGPAPRISRSRNVSA